MPVSPKQARFCEEYLIDFNATKAAIRAGYSTAAARQVASRLLTKANIKEHIESIRADFDQRFEGLDHLLRQLYRISDFDIKDLYNDDGSFKDIKDLDPDVSSVISGIEVEELVEGFGKNKVKLGFVKKIKLWNKNQALEQIARIRGWTTSVKISASSPDDKGGQSSKKEFNITLNL